VRALVAVARAAVPVAMLILSLAVMSFGQRVSFRRQLSPNPLAVAVATAVILLLRVLLAPVPARVLLMWVWVVLLQRVDLAVQSALRSMLSLSRKMTMRVLSSFSQLAVVVVTVASRSQLALRVGAPALVLFRSGWVDPQAKVVPVALSLRK